MEINCYYEYQFMFSLIRRTFWKLLKLPVNDLECKMDPSACHNSVRTRFDFGWQNLWHSSFCFEVGVCRCEVGRQQDTFAYAWWILEQINLMKRFLSVLRRTNNKKKDWCNHRNTSRISYQVLNVTVLV